MPPLDLNDQSMLVHNHAKNDDDDDDRKRTILRRFEGRRSSNGRHKRKQASSAAPSSSLKNYISAIFDDGSRRSTRSEQTQLTSNTRKVLESDEGRIGRGADDHGIVQPPPTAPFDVYQSPKQVTRKRSTQQRTNNNKRRDIVSPTVPTIGHRVRQWRLEMENSATSKSLTASPRTLQAYNDSGTTMTTVTMRSGSSNHASFSSTTVAPRIVRSMAKQREVLKSTVPTTSTTVPVTSRKANKKTRSLSPSQSHSRRNRATAKTKRSKESSSKERKSTEDTKKTSILGRLRRRKRRTPMARELSKDTTQSATARRESSHGVSKRSSLQQQHQKERSKSPSSFSRSKSPLQRETRTSAFSRSKSPLKRETRALAFSRSKSPLKRENRALVSALAHPKRSSIKHSNKDDRSISWQNARPRTALLPATHHRHSMPTRSLSPKRSVDARLSCPSMGALNRSYSGRSVEIMSMSSHNENEMLSNSTSQLEISKSPFYNNKSLSSRQHRRSSNEETSDSFHFFMKNLTGNAVRRSTITRMEVKASSPSPLQQQPIAATSMVPLLQETELPNLARRTEMKLDPKRARSLDPSQHSTSQQISSKQRGNDPRGPQKASSFHALERTQRFGGRRRSLLSKSKKISSKATGSTKAVTRALSLGSESIGTKAAAMGTSSSTSARNKSRRSSSAKSSRSRSHETSRLRNPGTTKVVSKASRDIQRQGNQLPLSLLSQETKLKRKHSRTGSVSSVPKLSDHSGACKTPRPSSSDPSKRSSLHSRSGRDAEISKQYRMARSSSPTKRASDTAVESRRKIRSESPSRRRNAIVAKFSACQLVESSRTFAEYEYTTTERGRERLLDISQILSPPMSVHPRVSRPQRAFTNCLDWQDSSQQAHRTLINEQEGRRDVLVEGGKQRLRRQPGLYDIGSNSSCGNSEDDVSPILQKIRLWNKVHVPTKEQVYCRGVIEYAHQKFRLSGMGSSIKKPTRSLDNSHASTATNCRVFAAMHANHMDEPGYCDDYLREAKHRRNDASRESPRAIASPVSVNPVLHY